MFDAVLFDFFGTLTTAIQRGPAHTAIARSLGCDPARFNAALNRTFRDRATGCLGTPADVLRALADEQGAGPGADRLAEAVDARVDAVHADITLRPDAVGVLAGLRRLGLRIALVSDCWYELPALLPRLAVAPLLDAAVFSFDVGHCKPHPAVYRTACDRLAVSARRCLYVGDGGGRELTGALHAGMTPVRLAAADLAGHLAFDRETGWRGASVGTLSELFEFLVAIPQPV